MGGAGSTRWGTTLTCQTTEGLPRLDVRELERVGALLPGASAAVSWAIGATITLHRPRDGSPRVVLGYRTRQRHGRWQAFQDTIGLGATPCTFGGTRTRFVCPGCRGRSAVLFACSGVFRCRACHRLTYPSTRQLRP